MVYPFLLVFTWISFFIVGFNDARPKSSIGYTSYGYSEEYEVDYNSGGDEEHYNNGDAEWHAERDREDAAIRADGGRMWNSMSRHEVEDLDRQAGRNWVDSDYYDKIYNYDPEGEDD